MRAECCFCGNEIVPYKLDPMPIVLRGESDEEQELFCHCRCLRKAVYPTIPLLCEDGQP